MGKKHLSDITVILMISTALCFDAIQAIIGWIPVFGNILADLFSIFVFMTFLLWFWMNGISMITPKRFASMGGGFIIEMIPYINLLPAWTLVVVYLVGTTKIEEIAEKHPALAGAAKLASGKISSISSRRTPNTPGFDSGQDLEEQYST